MLLNAGAGALGAFKVLVPFVEREGRPCLNVELWGALTCYIDQIGLELTQTNLPLPQKGWDSKPMCLTGPTGWTCDIRPSHFFSVFGRVLVVVVVMFCFLTGYFLP